jgi:hypothetical protein
MEKILNQKNLQYFFWTPLGSRVCIKINFILKLILSSQQSDNCSHCLPPALLTLVAIATGINNTSETSGKICHGVVDTSGKFATLVVDAGGAP